MPKTLSNLNLNKNEIQNVVVHKSSTALSSPVEGQIYYNTTDKNFYRYNGTSWVTYQGEITANGILQGDGNGNITATSTESVTLLSIDSAPTPSSDNLVTSGGVASALGDKQDTLVSGTNIKTINNTSILGSGNIDIQSGDSLPSQSGQSGKFLTTDGTDASWANVPTEIPSQTGNNGKYLTTNGSAVSWGSISIPTSYASTPEMDGTASSGSSTSWSRGDHVHPTDTSRASSTHVHGNITNGGDITTTATIANGDRLVINDESDSKIVNSSITFGTSETQFLTNKGTWLTPPYPVTSVNSKTGAVTLSASDVGALPSSTSIPTKTSDLTNDSGYITSSAVPTAYTSNPAMNGIASAGSSTNWAKGDHVHPVDTSRQAQIYTDTITTTTTWTGSGPYTQTVTLANYTATANSKVDLQPNSTVIGQLVTDGVTALYVSNTSGTLTLNAIGAAPSTAMTLQVSITEVSAA